MVRPLFVKRAANEQNALFGTYNIFILKSDTFFCQDL